MADRMSYHTDQKEVLKFIPFSGYVISNKKLNPSELSLAHLKMITHWVPPYPILVRINKIVHGKTFVNSEVLHKCIIFCLFWRSVAPNPCLNK